MSALQAPVAPPEEVRLCAGRSRVELHWPDGHVSRLSSVALRAACACSACNLARQQGRAVAGNAAVTIDGIEPMGASGLQFFFSDGHSRGHFPWRYLRELGAAQ